MRASTAIAFAAAALIASAPGEVGTQQAPATAVVRTTLTKTLSPKALVENGIEILHVYADGRADLAVTDDQLRWLETRGAPVAVLERASRAAPALLDENLGAYHTYAETNALLDSLAAAQPFLVRVDSIGRSWEGRAIRAIKISRNAAIDEMEPEILIMGCHHAREIMSVEVPLLFARGLVERYGTDPLVTNLVDTRQIWIVPMLNVDGHVYVEQHHDGSAATWWNKNRRPNGDGSDGVDLNRNYGFMWGYDDTGSSGYPSSWQYRGTGPFSEYENQAVRDLVARRHFAICLSYHSYGEQILFPWGYVPENTPDHETFLALGYAMQEGNGYVVGNVASGTVYPTNGDSDDWLYGDTSARDRVFGFTVELNTYEQGGYAPPESLIAPTCAEMFPLNLAAVELAGDSLLSHAMPAPPLSRLAQNYPNPFNPSTTIEFTVGAGDATRAGRAPVCLRIYDVAGRLIAVLERATLTPGAYSVSWDGRDSRGARAPTGMYFAQLRVGATVLARKLVILR